MSLAREEVIETVRDYKTSKQCREGRPLEQAGVTAVAGMVWEPSRGDVNTQTPSEPFYCPRYPMLSLVWETELNVMTGDVWCLGQEPVNV